MAVNFRPLWVSLSVLKKVHLKMKIVMHLLTLIFPNLFDFPFSAFEIVILVWNDIRVSKWWQFYSFNIFVHLYSFIYFCLLLFLINVSRVCYQVWFCSWYHLIVINWQQGDSSPADWMLWGQPEPQPSATWSCITQAVSGSVSPPALKWCKSVWAG